MVEYGLISCNRAVGDAGSKSATSAGRLQSVYRLSVRCKLGVLVDAYVSRRCRVGSHRAPDQQRSPIAHLSPLLVLAHKVEGLTAPRDGASEVWRVWQSETNSARGDTVALALLNGYR